VRLPNKDPAETKTITFVYSADLMAATTIESVEVALTVHTGEDATVATMLRGAAVINNATREVYQRVGGGVDGVTYELRCLATTSDGQAHLVAAALPVRRYAPVRAGA
jgi:hypothetical protein